MNKVIRLVRNSGVAGIPAGEFRRTHEVDVEQLGEAERIAMDWLEFTYVPGLIRVEANIDAEYPDITLEAEIDLNGKTYWFIGPPPSRVRN